MSTASETVDESEAGAAPRPGLILRLKRLLAAPLSLLERLRRRKPKAEDAEAESTESGSRDGGREEVKGEEAEAPAAPPPWRRLLPYSLVLLAGATAGGSLNYWFSAQVISRQAAVLGEQQAEIERLKGLLAGYDKMILKNQKKLEEEQGKRVELENRLAIAQADLMRQPPAVGSRASAAPRRPSTAAAEASKGGNCTLRPGTIGSSLKDCLAEFNRP